MRSERCEPQQSHVDIDWTGLGLAWAHYLPAKTTNKHLGSTRTSVQDTWETKALARPVCFTPHTSR